MKMISLSFFYLVKTNSYIIGVQKSTMPFKIVGVDLQRTKRHVISGAIGTKHSVMMADKWAWDQMQSKSCLLHLGELLNNDILVINAALDFNFFQQNHFFTSDSEWIDIFLLIVSYRVCTVNEVPNVPSLRSGLDDVFNCWRWLSTMRCRNIWLMFWT